MELLVVRHERRQRLVGIEQDEVARTLQRHDVERSNDQFPHDGGPLARRGDDDARLAVGQPLAEELGDDLGERFLVVVETNGVIRNGRN